MAVMSAVVAIYNLLLAAVCYRAEMKDWISVRATARSTAAGEKRRDKKSGCGGAGAAFGENWGATPGCCPCLPGCHYQLNYQVRCRSLFGDLIQRRFGAAMASPQPPWPSNLNKIYQ